MLNTILATISHVKIPGGEKELAAGKGRIFSLPERGVQAVEKGGG